MEGPSNGGMLYHEVQESKLCAVHCVNTVLQGPFFSEIDLAALASDLDQTERQMMNHGSSGDFSMEDSHNVSLGGDFSIQVLEKALGVWDLQVIPFNSPVAEASNYDPELETAFICHLHDHWFCVRKVNGEWFNFNSLYAAPEHLSKFYLSAFLDTLRGSGWSIFIVRGNFPKDCPIPTSNAFGQWLTPEDARRITKSCNEMQARAPKEAAPAYSSQFMREADALAAQEEHDLNAAIAASLMDTSGFSTGLGSLPEKDAPASSPAVSSQGGAEAGGVSVNVDAAIAASLMASAFGQGPATIPERGNIASPVSVGFQPNANESSISAPQAEAEAEAEAEADDTTAESIATVSSDPAEVHKPEARQDVKDQ